MRERLLYIDAIRGFAIFLVVLGHILIFNGYEKSIITTTIYSFHMPLFMFISGYVARYSYKDINSIKQLIKTVFHKFTTILLPYLVFCILVRPLFFNNPINYIEQITLNGIQSIFLSEYWFLPCLFILTMCFLCYVLIIVKINGGGKLLNLISKTLIIFVITVVIYILSLSTELPTLKKCILYIPFYFAGVLFLEYNNVFIRVYRNQYIVSILFISFAILCGLYNDYVGTGIVASVCRFLCGLFSIPICFSIFSNMSEETKVFKLLSYIGLKTLGLYLIHFFFINNWPIEDYSLFPTIIVSILGSILVIGFCLFIIKLIEKNKVLSLLLLGKK